MLSNHVISILAQTLVSLAMLAVQTITQFPARACFYPAPYPDSRVLTLHLKTIIEININQYIFSGILIC